MLDRRARCSQRAARLGDVEFFALAAAYRRNAIAISCFPLLSGLDRTTSHRCVCAPTSSLQRQPTARDSLRRNDTPLSDRSRVRMSWRALGDGPSSTTSVALLMSGSRLVRRRSALAGDVGASETAPARRGANGFLD